MAPASGPTAEVAAAPAPAGQPLAAPSLRSLLLGAALALPMIGATHAESAPERGLVALKYLDYLDRQPGIDRIRVRAPALSVLAPVGGDWAVGGALISDAISGASPAFHSSGIK